MLSFRRPQFLSLCQLHGSEHNFEEGLMNSHLSINANVVGLLSIPGHFLPVNPSTDAEMSFSTIIGRLQEKNKELAKELSHVKKVAVEAHRAQHAKSSVKPRILQQLLRRGPIPWVHPHDLADEVSVLHSKFRILSHRERFPQSVLVNIVVNNRKDTLSLFIGNVDITMRKRAEYRCLLSQHLGGVIRVIHRITLRYKDMPVLTPYKTYEL